MPKWGFAQVDQQWYNTEPLLADARRMYDEVRPLAPEYWRIGAPWPLIARQKDPGAVVAGTPPTNQNRDWSTVDTALNEALLLGTKVVLILGVRRCTWGGFQLGPFNIGGVASTTADFAAHCTEVVNRYKPGGVGIRTDGRYASNAGKGVRIFEIFNEPNDQNHWGGQVSPKDYTDHLIAGFDAIKAILPGTQSTVLFGGTYHVQRVGPWLGYGIASLPEVDWVSRCYEYGAKNKFDAMAVHVYPHLDDQSFNGSSVGPAPSPNLDNWRQMLEIRQLMITKGDAGKTIWVTEAGFPNSVVSEAQQNAFWQQLWSMFAALSYVEVVLFYCARDKGTDPKDVESTWGAMRYDFSKKPVWDWLKSLSPLPSTPGSLAGTGVLVAAVARAAVTQLGGIGGLSAEVRAPLRPGLSGSGSLTVLADVNSNERNANLTGVGGLSASVAACLSVDGSASGAGVLSGSVKPVAVVSAALSGSGMVTAQSYSGADHAERTVALGSVGSLTAEAVIPVQYQSTGAGGATTGTSSSRTTSWSHTIPTTGMDVVVLVAVGASFTGGTGFGSSATYGGQSMSLLGTQSGSGVAVRIFGLRNPPAGAQSVSVSLSRTGTGGSLTALAGTSVSYTKVGDLDAAVGINGGSATRVITVDTDPGSYTLGVTAGANQNDAISPTARFSIFNPVDGNGDAVSVQDAPWSPSGTVTHSTSQVSIGTWSSCGIALNPVRPTVAQASLSGDGVLSASVQIGNPVAAAVLSGDGALAATGMAAYAPAVVLTGIGTITATTFEKHRATPALTGAGTLTTSLFGNVQPALNGSGVLGSTTLAKIARTAGASGAGTLTATATPSHTRTATLTGDGQLTATAAPGNNKFSYKFPFKLG